MTESKSFEFLRTVDLAALRAEPADRRFAQRLLDRSNGGQRCAVSYIRTPPGSGSPEGRHVHDFEQVFYVLAGTMSIEVDGNTFDAAAGSVVVFPRGVPHRNWNSRDDETVHLAINVPAPEMGVPIARAVP